MSQSDETQHEFAYEQTETVLDGIDFDDLLDTIVGRNGLYVNKPDTSGLYQYIWRNAVFRSSQKDSLPVMSRSWLQTWLDKQDINARVIGMKHDRMSSDEKLAQDAGEEILDMLDDVVDAVIVETGGDPTAAARSMKGILY